MKNLNVKTSGWDMTDEISAYLDEKVAGIEKMLADPDDGTLKCDVELAQTREQHASVARADMRLSINGESYRAEATGETMQAAIDALKDDMQRQLRKVKSKNSSLLKRGGAQLKRWMKFGRE